MKPLYAFASFGFLALSSLNAQYCAPTFINGCGGWQIMSMSAGTSFNWNSSDCAAWDQTAYMISGNAGDSILMSVTSGAWCGAALWVDWDNNGNFVDAENAYHQYIGGDPSFTYQFSLGIPVGTPAGQYRLRMIGAWGSDGFTGGSQNGFGPCGSFQYGNYNDFTLQVSAPTAVTALEATTTSMFTISPNPSSGSVRFALGAHQGMQIDLVSMDGRTVRTWHSAGASYMEVDLSELPAGLYLVQDRSNAEATPLRLVKL